MKFFVILLALLLNAFPAIAAKLEQEGEVINVEGVELEKTFTDFLCLFMQCKDGVPSLPPEGDRPGPGGGGRQTPTPPTEEACQDAFRECQKAATGSERERCEMTHATTSGLLVNNRRTCHGDPSELMNDEVIEHISCGQRDWTDGTDALSTACRGRFMLRALEECALGTEKGGSRIPFSFTFNLPLVGSIGYDPNKVTIEDTKGAGYRTLCSAAAQKASNEGCEQARTTCVTASKGGSPFVLPPREPTIAELLGRIDHKRLKLGGPGLGEEAVAAGPEPRFVGTRQGARELDTLYRARLQFLGNWSRFLQATGTTTAQQQRLQRALLGAQTGMVNGSDAFVAHAVSAFLTDAKTGEVGTQETRVRFMRFVKNHDLERRATAAENALLQEVRLVLGNTGLKRFLTDVWPDIYVFGASRPLQTPQVVNP